MSEGKNEENSISPIKGLIGNNLAPLSQNLPENEANQNLPNLHKSILKPLDNLANCDEDKELPSLKQKEIGENENKTQIDENNQQSETDFQQPVSVNIDVDDKNEVSIDKTEEKMENKEENIFVIKPDDQQNYIDSELNKDACESQIQSSSYLDESADETQKNDQTTSPLSEVIRDNLMDGESNNNENGDNSNTKTRQEDLKPPSRKTPRHNTNKRSATSYSSPSSPQKMGQTAILGKKEFIAMMKRKPYGRTLSVQPKDMKSHESSVASSQIPGMADNLLKGRN